MVYKQSEEKKRKAEQARQARMKAAVDAKFVKYERLADARVKYSLPAAYYDRTVRQYLLTVAERLRDTPHLNPNVTKAFGAYCARLAREGVSLTPYRFDNPERYTSGMILELERKLDGQELMHAVALVEEVLGKLNAEYRAAAIKKYPQCAYLGFVRTKRALPTWPAPFTKSFKAAQRAFAAFTDALEEYEQQFGQWTPPRVAQLQPA